MGSATSCKRHIEPSQQNRYTPNNMLSELIRVQTGLLVPSALKEADSLRGGAGAAASAGTSADAHACARQSNATKSKTKYAWLADKSHRHESKIKECRKYSFTEIRSYESRDRKLQPRRPSADVTMMNDRVVPVSLVTTKDATNHENEGYVCSCAEDCY